MGRGLAGAARGARQQQPGARGGSAAAAAAARGGGPPRAGDAGRERERSPRGRRSRESRREAWSCPACGQILRRLEKVPLHARGCCPDLWDQEAWVAAAGEPEALRGLLDAWRVRELALRERAAAAAWGLEDGIRREVPAVAGHLGLPEERVRRMLKAYSKATPLAADVTPVEVLHEDAAVLALVKPPGLRSTPRHRFEGNSLLGRAIGHLQRAAGVPQLPEEDVPRVVHRLDMDTSGVVVFGKTRAAAQGLTRQFAERSTTKTYLALVAGVPEAESFDVCASIARDKNHEVGMVALPEGLDDGAGKPSRTLVRVLASSANVDLGSCRLGDSEQLDWKRDLGPGRWPQGASLVEATPLTGRTHQIRLHLSHAGFPILGDTVYGLFHSEETLEGEPGLWGALRRQALHAHALQLEHPETGESVRYSAVLPADMRAAANHLGLDVPEELTCLPTSSKDDGPGGVSAPSP